LVGYRLISHYSTLPYFDEFTITKDLRRVFFDEGNNFFNEIPDLGAKPDWITFSQ